MWRTHLAWQLRWAFWAATLLLPIAAWFVLRNAHVLSPLSFLPLALPAILLAGVAPKWILSTILFYVPTVVAAAVVWRLYESSGGREGGESLSRRHIAVAFVVGSILFGAFGLYFTTIAGGHVGDEAHYRTIATSLYRHRTLDLKPLMMDKIVEDGGEPTDPETLEAYGENIHRNEKAKGGHWYSTHSYGLPLLLAPFGGAGNLGRHIALGLIAGLACAGMLALCAVTTDKGKPEALLVISALALSNVWAVYAARTLPETLGAALLVWAYWAISDQASHKWRSLIVAAACCIYMPFAHVRFAPLSLLAFGFYGLYGLFGDEPWGRKILRLGVFTVACGAGYAAYLMIQCSMFDGGDPYRVTTVARAPLRMGAWWSLSDTKGLVHIWPVFIWLLGAQVACLVYDKRSRPFVVAVLVAFFADLMLSCTTPGWRNGSSLPGKKLVVVLPLLLPAAVVVLRRAGPTARRWFVFLAMVSVSYLFVTTVRLEVLGRSFHHGPLILGVKLPALQDLLDPHVANGRPYTTAIGVAVANAWVIGAFLLTALMLLISPRRQLFSKAAVVMICAGAVVSHMFAHINHSSAKVTRGQIQRQLEKLELQHVWIPTPFPSAPLPLNSTIAAGHKLCSLTTEDLGKHVRQGAYSLPRLKRNDWNDRDYKWATMIVPFRPTEGDKIVSLTGTVDGDVKPVLALREGAHTIVEHPLAADSNGVVRASFAFKADGGRGDMYVLMRLDGDNGTFIGEELHISAANDRFLQQSGLTPPPGLIRITDYP